MSLQEYKCPRCGGAVEFDSSLQNLPVDKKRYHKICALVMAGSTLGIYGIAWLIHMLMYFI